MLVALAGWMAGLTHVVSGPDHLAAVAPLASGKGGRAVYVGLRWALGHVTGVALIGTIAIVARGALPIEAISHWSERLVGVVLIAIGFWGIRGALRRRIHVHQHEHDGHRHAHVHIHDSETAHPADPSAMGEHGHRHAAFAVGALHGAAGTSHLFGLIPALALPTTTQTVVYLAGYAVGTVVAMGAFSAVAGIAAGSGVSAARRIRGFTLATSAAAIAVGLYWLAGA